MKAIRNRLAFVSHKKSCEVFVSKFIILIATASVPGCAKDNQGFKRRTEIDRYNKADKASRGKIHVLGMV